jgi:DNA-binding NarL/FixJ family response regulator
MATVLLVGVDLFLRGKLEAMLPEHHLVSVEGVDPPDLVIADIARIDANDVAETFPDVPLLGFTNHKDTEGLRRAHAAGFDRVVVKSALFERPGEVIQGLLTSLE